MWITFWVKIAQKAGEKSKKVEKENEKMKYLDGKKKKRS